MARKKSKDEAGQFEEFVPVIYARNLTEAEFYKGLLASNDIPAIIEDEAGEVIGMPTSVVGQGVAVLVPDEMLDEASEIIAEHDDTEEDAELDEYEDMEDEADDDLDEDLDEDLEDEEFEDEDLDEDDEDLDEIDDDLDDDLEEADDEEDDRP